MSTPPDAAELLRKLERMQRGLAIGRPKAIALNQARRADTDRRMRNFFQTCRRLGYSDHDILHKWATKEPVKRDTARRRARRLGLLRE